jgi:hypothetical protein
MKNLNNIAYELVCSCENVNDLEYYLDAAYLIINEVPRCIMLKNRCCQCCKAVYDYIWWQLEGEASVYDFHEGQ